MTKGKVLLTTSILLMNVLFLLPLLIYTPVKGLDYGMDQDLGNVDASFCGEDEGDQSGYSVACAGDVNGDGYDDILIGAWCNSEREDWAGQTYLVFGKASGWSMDMNLSASDASFLGENIDDFSGCSVAGAGDVNGDGFEDIMIGDRLSVVQFCHPTPWSILSPLPSTVTPANPLRYPAIAAAERLDEVLWEINLVEGGRRITD